VKVRLMSKCRWVLFSLGIDSSAVVRYAEESSTPVKTFRLGLKETGLQ